MRRPVSTSKDVQLSAVFGLDELRARQADGDHPYLEFLCSPELSAGLYVLPAGSVDPQKPHTEDEVYYVISGSATLTAADGDQAVTAGSTVFVATGIDHRFHTITEDLVVLVVFAPPRRSRSAAGT